MTEFDKFRLKGTGAYVKVSSATKKVVPVGRLYSVWARAEGVPDEVKHYKAICEVGSLIGAVDDVDMQILPNLDVVRFQVDVRSIKKFPMTKQFAIKPWMYNITFSIERMVEEGNLDEMEIEPMENDKTKEKDQSFDEEEQAREAKKLKATKDEIVCEKKGIGATNEQVGNETEKEASMTELNQMQNNEEKLLNEGGNFTREEGKDERGKEDEKKDDEEWEE
jgi:hypothetical protein